MLFRRANRNYSASLAIVMICCALLCACITPCWGQSDAPITFPDGLDDLVTPQDQLPPAIYMLDDGMRVFIPITSYRDFERRNQSIGNTQAVRPPYTFESIEISGEATEGRAELDVVLKIDMDADFKSEVSIPLEMGNFHRLTPFAIVGMESAVGSYDRASGSQMITGTPNKPQIEVRAKFSVLVSQVDARYQIDFRLPDAPTTAKLKVDQQQPFALIAGSTNDAILRKPEPTEDEKSLIPLEASGGDFTLSWGASQEKTPQNQSLEVEGDWKIDWEDPQQAPRMEVTYKVRNLSGNVQPFEMKIPSQFSISPLSFSDVSIDQIDESTYRVTPSLAETPRLTFQFQVDVPGADYRSESPLTLAGISIEGSVRETGMIKVRTTRDHRLRWSEGRFVRPLISVASGEGEGRAYDFRYDRGAFALPIWLSVKASGMRMQVDYEASIGTESIQLDMLVNVSGSGTTGQSLTFDFRQWELQRINDQALIDLSLPGVEPTAEALQIEVDELMENLKPISGQRRQLKIQFIRPLTPGNSVVTFDVPAIKRPATRRSDLIFTPGQIRVLEDPNVLLAFDPSKSRGLQPQADLTGGGETRAYQLLSAFTSARLTHTVALRTTQISAAMSVELGVVDDQCLLNQRFSIEFSKGTLASIPLATSFGDVKNVAGTIHGKPVFAKTNPDGSDEIRFDPLPPGTYELQLTQRFPFPSATGATTAGGATQTSSSEDPSSDSVRVALPICLPAELAGGGEFEVPIKVTSEAWGLATSEPTDEPIQTLKVVPGKQPEVSLVRRRQSDQTSLFVDRVWIQSMIGSTMRRERVLMRLQGTSESLQLGSPHWNDDVLVRASIDGGELQDLVIDNNRVEIALPKERDSVLVEVWIWERNFDPSAAIDTVRPHVQMTAPYGECYWQLVLPSGQHLVHAGLESGRAMQWQWRMAFLARKPILSTTELERLFGTTTSESLPPSNTYLFIPSDLKNLNTTVAKRSTIWLFVGGITLILSSAVVYLRPLRNPLTFLVLGFILAGLAVTMPDLAVVFGQVSIVALILTMVLLAIRYAVAGWPQASVFDTPLAREGSTRSVPNRATIGSTKSMEPRRVSASVEANP